MTKFLLKNSISIIAIIWFLMIFGCKSGYISATINSGDKDSETPQILVINFEINSKDSVLVLNQSLSPGKLRSKESHSDGFTGDSLLITFYDNRGSNCYKTSLSNPLIRRVEYSDNLSNLSSKIVHLDKTQFTIRVQYKGCMSIGEVKKLSNNATVSLKSFEVNKP
jgi:hypothetical protein